MNIIGSSTKLSVWLSKYPFISLVFIFSPYQRPLFEFSDWIFWILPTFQYNLFVSLHTYMYGTQWIPKGPEYFWETLSMEYDMFDF